MTDPERFHLTLTVDGRAVAEGWWADETVARAKHREWVGDFGRPAAHVTLVDDETGEELAAWPDAD